MKIIPNQIYQHYKTKDFYQVVSIVKDSETLEPMVVYQNIKTKETWVRSLSMFSGQIIIRQRKVKRFKLISASPKVNKIIIASGPVIVENNCVLLVKHGKDNFWKFCGGRIENQAENLITTAQRESQEELGINLQIMKQDPYFYYTQKKDQQTVIDIILVHYLAKRRGVIKPGADIKNWQWLKLSEINRKHDLAPNITPTLKHFLLIK
ncbi:MAG: hypothetical protein CO133_00570 [Candidatus Komeilibacteria bacterium CG_4_9_14_3_um_filter_37_5]|nr:MAG: hypothetical protein CO133_00570 [Candidatus Komeilibacteria bacterium CG_4_9_14_3_um_filter_37_5]